MTQKRTQKGGLSNTERHARFREKLKTENGMQVLLNLDKLHSNVVLELIENGFGDNQTDVIRKAILLAGDSCGVVKLQ